MEERTLNFSVAVIKIVGRLQFDLPIAGLRTQLINAATSIGANYREANRAESLKDFLHKVGIAEKEASETVYWLRVFSGVLKNNKTELKQLEDESSQLLAILTTIAKNARKGNK